MRILFLTHYFFPEGNAPAARVFEMAKQWVADGHEVQVITCAPNIPNGVLYEGYKNRYKLTEFIDGIHVTRVWTYITANKGTVKRSLNYLSYMFTAVIAGLFVKKPDIIIATSPQLFCGLAGALVSKLRNIPFLLEIRDVWPLSIVVAGAIRNKLVLRCLEWLEVRMYRSAQNIVTVGTSYRQELCKRGVPFEKISIVMNGLDTALFTPRKCHVGLKEQLGLKGKFVCSYIGTIGLACGLDVVIRAAQILINRNRCDIAFMLVGDGAVREALELKAKRLNLGNIVFTGRQDRRQVPALLSISDVCLIHLRKHDFFRTCMPSKIFEAAGMAKPIILGIPGFAAGIIRSANAGLEIEPGNAEQFAEAVEKLADNPHLCLQFGKSGYEYVKRNFDRVDLARKYLDIITTVASPAAEAVLTNQMSTNISKR